MVRSSLVLIVFLQLASLCSPARQIHFATAINTNSGLSGPGSVAIGDFNRDGLLDVVITDHVSTLSVLLGLGNGTFNSPVTYTLDSFVSNQVAVAEFNGDGIADLAVVEGGLTVPSTLAVLLGNGDGTFGSPTYYSTSIDGAGLSLAIGDLNHDGILDIFLGGAGASTVLLGDPGGGFHEGQFQSVSGFWIAEGDFNDDGNLDVALTGGINQNISVLLGNGDGTFQAPVSYSGGNDPIGIVSADFNHDKKLDLATAAFNDTAVDVLLGNGDGTFGTGREWAAGTQPTTLVASDFNRDHNIDLAVADDGQGGVDVLAGKGDGTFLRGSFFATGKNATFVAPGDFNNDGSVDLVVTNDGDNTVSVLLNAAGTNVALTSSMNPSHVGQAVTFTATVAATVSTSIPTGTVIFKDGMTLLGNASLSNGVAAFTTSGLQQGKHRIVAVYEGDSSFNPNASAILIQRVR